jgi:hypothetical protein
MLDWGIPLKRCSCAVLIQNAYSLLRLLPVPDWQTIEYFHADERERWQISRGN